jgi:hypothetical protein
MLIISESKMKNAVRNMNIYNFYLEALKDGSKPDAVYKHLAKEYGITKARVNQIIASMEKKNKK